MRWKTVKKEEFSRLAETLYPANLFKAKISSKEKVQQDVVQNMFDTSVDLINFQNFEEADKELAFHVADAITENRILNIIIQVNKSKLLLGDMKIIFVITDFEVVRVQIKINTTLSIASD